MDMVPSIPIFLNLQKPSARREIEEFISKRKLELILVTVMVIFVTLNTVYLGYGSLESIRYAGSYIIPWAYPLSALGLFHFKMYIASQKLVKMEPPKNRKDLKFLLKAGGNAFNFTVFLFGDLVSLTASMLSYYPIGYGNESDIFQRLHSIEPEISCSILPFLAIVSSCLLDY